MEGWRYTLMLEGEPQSSTFVTEQALNEGSRFTFDGREMVVVSVEEPELEGTTATIKARPLTNEQ